MSKALQRLQEVKDLLGITQDIRLESSIKMFAEDSLDLIDNVMAIEDHYNINLPSPDRYKVVGDLVQGILDAQ